MGNIRVADISGLETRIRDVMLSGRIKALLPMSAVEDRGKTLGVYSPLDMICISDGYFDAKGILELIGRIIKMTEELEDYLIFPDEIVFSKDVVFIDPYRRATRILVIPQKEKKSDRGESVSCLLEELKELTDERGKAYISVFKERYRKRNMSTDCILGLIEELKREAGMV